MTSRRSADRTRRRNVPSTRASARPATGLALALLCGSSLEQLAHSSHLLADPADLCHQLLEASSEQRVLTLHVAVGFCQRLQSLRGELGMPCAGVRMMQGHIPAAARVFAAVRLEGAVHDNEAALRIKVLLQVVELSDPVAESAYISASFPCVTCAPGTATSNAWFLPCRRLEPVGVGTFPVNTAVLAAHRQLADYIPPAAIGCTTRAHQRTASQVRTRRGRTACTACNGTRASTARHARNAVERGALNTPPLPFPMPPSLPPSPSVPPSLSFLSLCTHVCLRLFRDRLDNATGRP